MFFRLLRIFGTFIVASLSNIKSMKRIIILVSIFLVFTSEITAEVYPITPAPLRKLINESEIIIVGRVEYTKPQKNKESWTSEIAFIKVKEVLQGSIEDSIVKVFFSPNMVCPSPASYPKGEKVIAFLDKTEHGYTTHSLSYGSKILDESGIKVYKSRILEMQQINKIENESEKRQEITNWLFKCIKHKMTRWEGAYELSPKSDFMSFYDRSSKKNEVKFILNETQKHELRKILFSENSFKYFDIGLVDLTQKGSHDNEMKDFLVEFLKSHKNNIWFPSSIMKRIAYFDNRENLKRIIAKLENEYDYSDFKNEQLRKNKLVNEFLNNF